MPSLLSPIPFPAYALGDPKKILPNAQGGPSWVSYGNRDIPEPTVVVYKRLLSASGLAYSDEMALTIADRDAKCRIQLMVSMLYDVISPLDHLVVRIGQRLVGCADVTEIREI